MVEKIAKYSNPVASRPVFNFPLRTKYMFLALLGFVFYANSIPDKYALDDKYIILNNAYVQMGLPGIPKILTHDAYAGYCITIGINPNDQEISGGRYRPLSQIIFALENQLFGNSSLLPYFRHLVNILAYIICVLIIFYFLENILFKKIPGGSDISFLSAFLFTIHPIHTEVVANVKSLDEILCLLFILLTFIFSIKYLSGRKTKQLVIGTGTFLLALLSKEYAITLIFFIPFLFYLLANKKPYSSIIAAFPYIGVFAIYLLLRYNAVGFHSSHQTSAIFLVNNPYLYATHIQKIATEWFVLGKYLKLLLFSYPLSCDYSYYQIPYHNFSDITVLLSVVVYIAIFSWGIMLARKKNVLSFAVFFFLFTIIMISNFVFDIGATMGERLVFHASLGLVIILSFYLFRAISAVSASLKKMAVIVSMAVIGIACLGETVIRNFQWKNDTSLFLHDVKVVPNSCLANNNAGAYSLQLAINEPDSVKARTYYNSAHDYLLRALHFDPQYVHAYLSLGFVYLKLDKPDSAKYCSDMVKELVPNEPSLKSNYTMISQYYFDKGISSGNNGNIELAISDMKKAASIDSTNGNIWYNIGVAYFRTQQYDSARYAFIKTLDYQPDNENAKMGLQASSQMK